MKITVGHLVLAAGVGTFLVLGPLGGFHRMDKSEGSVATEKEAPVTAAADPLRDTASAPAADNHPALPFEERLPAGESEVKDVKAADVAPVAPLAEAPPADKLSEPVIPDAEDKPVRRRRKSRSPVEDVAAPPPPSSDNLVGTYVSLRLANGREVKGSLVEKSATLYKIELPGLGAMSYPARDVVSVVPAQ